jgi:hypothetical protein
MGGVDFLGDSDLCLLASKNQLRLRFPCLAAPARRRLPPSPPGHPAQEAANRFG